MNKICTNVKQSQKLIELGIDVNTADMHYMYRHWEIDEETIGSQSDASIGFNSYFYYGADNSKTYHYIPAWSLSTLLELMPDRIVINNENYFLNLTKESVEYRGIVTWDGQKCISTKAENLLDAAFEMVCWLLENNKI